MLSFFQQNVQSQGQNSWSVLAGGFGIRSSAFFPEEDVLLAEPELFAKYSSTGVLAAPDTFNFAFNPFDRSDFLIFAQSCVNPTEYELRHHTFGVVDIWDVEIYNAMSTSSSSSTTSTSSTTTLAPSGNLNSTDSQPGFSTIPKKRIFEANFGMTAVRVPLVVSSYYQICWKSQKYAKSMSEMEKSAIQWVHIGNLEARGPRLPPEFTLNNVGPSLTAGTAKELKVYGYYNSDVEGVDSVSIIKILDVGLTGANTQNYASNTDGFNSFAAINSESSYDFPIPVDLDVDDSQSAIKGSPIFKKQATVLRNMAELRIYNSNPCAFAFNYTADGTIAGVGSSVSVSDAAKTELTQKTYLV